DKRKPLGVAHACKECKRNERISKRDGELKRWKAYYAPGSKNRKRHVVRSQTRRKHGSAKEHACLFCGEQAEEWHHVEYITDGAIPICGPCHESTHTVERDSSII